MRPTKTLLGEKARKAVLRGVNAVYEPVKRTLGPQGKNGLIFRTFNRGSRIINDGYTIAECQMPADPFEALAAAAFKEGTKRTNERVGDGTTGTTVIAGKIVNLGQAMLLQSGSEIGNSAGTVGVRTLKNKILKSAEKIKEAIKAASVPVKTQEDLEKIATISVGDAELGKKIAAMAWEVGVDGHIDVVEGYKGVIETEIIKGYRFAAKVPNKAFVNNPARFEMVANDAVVLVTNYTIDNAKLVDEIITPRLAEGSGVILIAPSFSDTVLNAMYRAHFVTRPDGKQAQSGKFIYPVNAPSLRADQMEDLAVYCGAKFINKIKGHQLKGMVKDDFGFLEKLVIKDTEAREDAVVTGGKGALERVVSKVVPVVEEGMKKNILEDEKLPSKIEERIAILKSQLAETREDQFKKLLTRRIGAMSSAIGVIRVGGSTEAESLYQKLKIEDCVYASKAALRGGYVKGGGLCLKEIAETLEDSDIMKAAIREPYEIILASLEGEDISDDVIDPMEVVFYAVEHASQVAANLLTVEILTPQIEETQPGEGYEKIASMIGEYVIAQKRQMGQITASEEEAERDRMHGMADWEHVSLDNG